MIVRYRGTPQKQMRISLGQLRIKLGALIRWLRNPAPPNGWLKLVETPINTGIIIWWKNLDRKHLSNTWIVIWDNTDQLVKYVLEFGMRWLLVTSSTPGVLYFYGWWSTSAFLPPGNVDYSHSCGKNSGNCSHHLPIFCISIGKTFSNLPWNISFYYKFSTWIGPKSFFFPC